MLSRQDFHPGEKRGAWVGKTKRGKGSKVIAVADRTGLPLATSVGSASPHEITLVEPILQARFVAERPRRLIGDRAYDSDPLDERLAAQGIQTIAPHCPNHKEASHPRRSTVAALPTPLEGGTALRLPAELPPSGGTL
ncbi:hypothetical protein MPNT_120001 [Candidatus Methylacidithermus pantelleriae]|uniref:Transposase IS4-like domain-containing protein n=1 Tax=Candidatus Methylacidithermus pantelleriae TaxID=2744239 RepID=A0A8J2BN14_9BACT|nr:hypothetical protein MPNT_120001 [Candidatus Methylacidithermus pantelleriae]